MAQSTFLSILSFSKSHLLSQIVLPQLMFTKWISVFVIVVLLSSHGLQHTRLPSPSPSPGACSNSCPLSRWCLPTISASVIPFSSCLQSLPASGSLSSSICVLACIKKIHKLDELKNWGEWSPASDRRACPSFTPVMQTFKWYFSYKFLGLWVLFSPTGPIELTHISNFVFLILVLMASKSLTWIHFMSHFCLEVQIREYSPSR